MAGLRMQSCPAKWDWRSQPIPLKGEVANTCPSVKVGVFKNVFGIIVDLDDYNTKLTFNNYYQFTFEDIQKWIHDYHKVLVSKSSISSVKAKCGIVKISYKAGKMPEGNVIRSKAEKLVLEAFVALGIIQR